jgi:hypothetical protein
MHKVHGAGGFQYILAHFPRGTRNSHAAFMHGGWRSGTRYLILSSLSFRDMSNYYLISLQKDA